MDEQNKQSIKQSKLLELLRTLDESEKKKFAKYLNNILGKNKNALIVFDSYQKALKEGAKSKKLLKQLEEDDNYLFKKINSKAKKVGSTIDTLKSNLTQHIEKFLLLNEWDNEERAIEQLFVLLDVFHKRGLKNRVTNLLKTIQNAINDLDDLNSKRHYWQHKLSHLSFFDFSEARYRDRGTELKAGAEAFCIYTDLQRLEYLYEMKFRQINKNEDNQALIERLEEGLENRDIKEDYALITCYFLAIRLLTEKDRTIYFELKKQVFDIIDIVEKIEKIKGGALLTILINAATDSLSGKELYQELFIVYKYSVEHKYLLNGNSIDPNNFCNIVAIACEVGEYKWIEDDFLKEFEKYLSKGYADDYSSWALAMVAFKKKNWQGVRDLIEKRSLKSDFSYSCRVRLLLIKTYYEQREWGALNTELERYKTFLKDNPHFNEKTRLSYSNLLSFTKKLNQLYFNNTVDKIQKTKGDLNKKIVANEIELGGWLNEKLEEMTKKIIA